MASTNNRGEGADRGRTDEQDWRSTASLQPHAQAAQIPCLGRWEFEALVADIAKRGVLDPIDINPAGAVLDGHERLRAALELGLERLPVRIVAPSDERAHMLLAVLLRKHLNPGQRAALVLELPEIEQERLAARTRQQANLKQNAEVAGLPPRYERTRDRVARLAGVSARTVQDAETVRLLDRDLFEQVKLGQLPAERAARQLRRARRYAELGEASQLPEGPFQMIYADPPWQLGSPESPNAPENHYPTLPLEEIKALEVLAADDAVLFLWAVASRLCEALEVMRAWGFEPKSNLVWVKDGIGLGTWVRHRHELLLIGARGTFPPAAPSARPDSVIEAKRRRHSQKPDCVYELLEQMYPWASKLELFARTRRPGWASWGNEVAS
jgi:N6-adenosine-specific RNA methylase IME4